MNGQLAGRQAVQRAETVEQRTPARFEINHGSGDIDFKTFALIGDKQGFHIAGAHDTSQRLPVQGARGGVRKCDLFHNILNL